MKSKIQKMILITFLVIGLALSGASTAFGEPPVKTKVLGVKGVKISKELKGQLDKISQNLVKTKLRDRMAKSHEVRANTKVRRQVAKDTYDCDTLVTSLDQQTDTAYLDRIQFVLKKGKADKVVIEKDHKPVVKRAPPGPLGKDTNLEKQKADEAKKHEKTALEKEKDPRNFEKKLNSRDILKHAKDVEKKADHHSWWYARGLVDLTYTNLSEVTKYETYVWRVMNDRFPSRVAWRYGSSATKKEILDFLKYDYYLLAWQHKGHGNPYLLAMWDANIHYYYDLYRLPYRRGIYGSVAFVNSCNVASNPIRAAFIYNRPRTYIAPNVSISSVRSAKANYYFWYYVLRRGMSMRSALHYAALYAGVAGQYTLCGDGAPFFPIRYSTSWPCSVP